MKKLTGYDMDYFCRPPEGAYSERVLKVLQDMGYATMFWSLAYYDYEPSDEPGADLVVSKFKKHHFPGLMPLMHVISKSNRDALPRVIKYLKEKGYRIYLLSNYPDRLWKIQVEPSPFTAYIDGAVVSWEEHIMKPDRGFYQILLDRYQLNPEECL